MKQNLLSKLAVIMVALLLMACGSEGQEEQGKAESMIEKAYKAKDYNRLLQLADSLEKSGSLSQPKAYYWLGYASDRLKKLRMAEFYWKGSLEGTANSTDEDDLDIYAKSASRLANLLSVRGDYEGTLKLAVPAAEWLEKQHYDTTSDYMNLLIYIGCCQAALGESEASASDGFERAYQKHLDNIEKDHSDEAYKNAIAGLTNIAYYCIYAKKYQEARNWTGRYGELLNEYEQRTDANPDYIDKQLARFNIYQAIALQGLGDAEEAAKAYEAFKKTQYSQSPEGSISANDYLVAAKRWEEAADNYRSLDALLGAKKTYSLDVIETMVLKKYQANLIAGRRDSAVAVSMQISNSLGDALAQSKLLDKEEQVTIVKCVEEMTEKQAEKTRMQQLRWNAVIAVLFLCFVGYYFYRRRAGRKLADAYQSLMYDYESLESKTADRERKATEMRIAHDIQQTITLEARPASCEGLDICASRLSGELEGNGICEYLVRDGKLLLCVGNASANDVQASMLTAVAKTQFRTVAAYESDPARILSVMTAGIAKGKTLELFIAVLDAKTGQLNYCNTGKHWPLIIDEDVDRIPDEVQGFTVTPGTLFFFYTDGLLNAVNETRREYGEKRLLGEALQAMKLDPKAKPFVENMKDGLLRYIGEQKQTADIMMLAVKFTGSR